MLKTEIDFSELATVVNKIIDYAESGEAEKTAARTAKAQMLRRTEQGKDADGRKFTPYAESTKKLKRKKGQQTSVNLRDTGKMLESWGIDSESTLRPSRQYDKVVEGLVNDSRPGRPHREFVGVTDKEAEVQAKDIATEMKRKNLLAL